MMPDAGENGRPEPPQYLRIADVLRADIEAGRRRPGDVLPSLAELASTYRVSPAVARQTIEVLKRQALITASRGRRPTVRVPHTRRVRSNRSHARARARAADPVASRRAGGSLRDQLGVELSLPDVDFRAEYTRVAADDGVPEYVRGTGLLAREYEATDRYGRRMAWSVSWLPLDVVAPNPRLLDPNNEPWPGGTYAQLHTVGVDVAEVIETVTARPPSTAEVTQWAMPPGEPLLIVSGAMIDTRGRLVCVGRSHYPAEATELEFVTRLVRRAKTVPGKNPLGKNPLRRGGRPEWDGPARFAR